MHTSAFHKNLALKPQALGLLLLFLALAPQLILGQQQNLDAPPPPKSNVERVLLERMAAWQRTLVISSETVPHSAFLSYTVNKPSFIHHSLLLKIIPTVGETEEPFPANKTTELKVDDIPGGVTSSFVQNGIRINTEFVPLCVGGENKEWEGSTLYRISTNPPTPITLHLSAGTTMTQLYGSSPELNGVSQHPFAQPPRLHDPQFMTFQAGDFPHPMALRTNG